MWGDSFFPLNNKKKKASVPHQALTVATINRWQFCFNYSFLLRDIEGELAAAPFCHKLNSNDFAAQSLDILRKNSERTVCSEAP